AVSPRAHGAALRGTGGRVQLRTHGGSLRGALRAKFGGVSRRTRWARTLAHGALLLVCAFARRFTLAQRRPPLAVATAARDSVDFEQHDARCSRPFRRRAARVTPLCSAYRRRGVERRTREASSGGRRGQKRRWVNRRVDRWARRRRAASFAPPRVSVCC